MLAESVGISLLKKPFDAADLEGRIKEILAAPFPQDYSKVAL